MDCPRRAARTLSALASSVGLPPSALLLSSTLSSAPLSLGAGLFRSSHTSVLSCSWALPSRLMRSLKRSRFLTRGNSSRFFFSTKCRLTFSRANNSFWS